jgi:hypothetical protein
MTSIFLTKKKEKHFRDLPPEKERKKSCRYSFDGRTVPGAVDVNESRTPWTISADDEAIRDINTITNAVEAASEFSKGKRRRRRRRRA